jgi:diguanylate cyclase (GGDEF)-like protein
MKQLAAFVLAALALAASAQPPSLAERIDDLVREGLDWPDDALRELDALAKTVEPSTAHQTLLGVARGSIEAGAARAVPAQEQADALGELARTQSEPAAQAGAALVRALLARTQGRADVAAEQARLALAASKAACAQRRDAAPRCDHRIAWEALDIMAYYEDSRGVNVSARAQAQAAHELARDAGDLYRQARSLTLLANLAAAAGEADSAWRYFAQADRLVRQQGSPRLAAATRISEAAIAGRLGQGERSRRAAAAALPLARQARAPRLEAAALANLSDDHVKSSRPAEALRAVERALPIVRRYQDTRVERILLNNGGLAKIGLGRIAEARADLERLLEERGRIGATAQQANTLREFSDALARAGDAAGALELYHRERKLTEEFMALNRKTALDELHQRYDREAKQKSIELLSRDNALKNTDLDNRRLQQRIWLAAGALLALAGALIALLYRRVRETNRQLAESHAWLRVQSQRDALTGLANRRHFQDVMQTQGARAGALGGFEGALLLVDVDHFKHVNDGHGHEAGDQVLKELARRLKEAVRSEDLVVRWGGEEFLIFAPHLGAAQTEGLAERVLRGIADAPVVVGDGAALRVTVSIGYARFPLPPHELRVAWEQAVNLADMALYTAKAQGRNRAVGIASIAASEARALHDVEADFERAWGEGHVNLHQMPGPQPA